MLRLVPAIVHAWSPGTQLQPACLPAGLPTRAAQVSSAHRLDVNTLAVDPANRIVVTGGSDALVKVRVWVWVCVGLGKVGGVGVGVLARGHGRL